MYSISNYKSKVKVEDVLDSTSSTNALSANQGRELKTLIDNLDLSGDSEHTFTADGDITSTGIPVVLNTDGTVSEVESVLDPVSVKVSETFSDTKIGNYMQAQVYDEENDKTLCFYNGSNGATVEVIDIDEDGTITNEVLVVFDTSSGILGAVYDSVNKKSIVIYVNYDGTNNNIYGRVITVSGTSVSFSNRTTYLQFSGNQPLWGDGIFDSVNGQNIFCVSRRDVATTELFIVTVNSSGEAEYSSSYEVKAASLSYGMRLVLDSNNKLFVVMSGTTVRVCSLQPNFITFDTVDTSVPSGQSKSSATYDPDTDNVVIYTGMSNQYAVTCNYRNGILSFGTSTQIYSSNNNTSNYYDAVYDPIRKQTIFFFTYSLYSTRAVYLYLIKVNAGGSITSYSRPRIYLKEIYVPKMSFINNVDKLLLIYNCGGDNYTDLIKTYDSYVSTADRFIGLSNDTTTDGNDIPVLLQGAVSNDQSGLIPGDIYWVDHDGTLSNIDTGYPRVGVALESTSISIIGNKDEFEQVTVEDVLDSTSSTNALSANQGRELKTLIDDIDNDVIGLNGTKFTASGEIPNIGQTVSINPDGTVSVTGTTTTNNSFAQTVTTSSAGDPHIPSITYIGNDKIVAVYTDTSNANSITFIVGDIVNETITFGSPIVYSPSDAKNPSIECIGSNKIIFTYNYDSGSYRHPTACIGEITGTSITFGSPVILYGDSQAYTSKITQVCFDPTSQKIGFLYNSIEGNNSYYRLKFSVGDVSGNSITTSTPIDVVNQNIDQFNLEFNDSNTILIFYRDVADDNKGKTIAYDVTNITNISSGSTTTFSMLNSYSIQCARDVNNSQIIISVQNNTIYTITENSLSITVGSTLTLSSTLDYMKLFMSGSDKLYATYLDSVSGNISHTSFTVSLNSVTEDSIYTVGSHVVDDSFAVCINTTNNKMFIINNDSPYDLLEIDIFNPSTSVINADHFIGISQNTVSGGGDVYVLTNGGVDNNQTGLTIGSEYWVDHDGTLSNIDTGYPKVGFAISDKALSLYPLDVNNFI